MKYLATKAVAKFECLQADCPDTCCKGWSMQLDDETYKKYEGTELENAVAYDGVNNEIRVMKRDPETDFCIKFTEGICSIHADKGAHYLGDACNFYPRVTRNIAGKKIMTATLSCPEIARLMLFENSAAENIEQETDRFPNSLITYEKENLTADEMLKTHQAFLDACDDESVSPEQILSRIYSASLSLNFIDTKEWSNAASFMLKMADRKLPKPQPDSADSFKLLQVFAGIIHATGKARRERLGLALESIEKSLGVSVDWQSLTLNPTAPDALSYNLKKYSENKSKFDKILRAYIKSQLSFSTFPFAGLGDDIVDKSKLLIFRFAITRLGLMALSKQDVTQEKIVDIVQPISRVMDHLGSPTLTLNLMQECGWNTDAKIVGLINGV